MKLLFPTKATTKINGRMARRTFEDKMGDRKQAKRWWKVKISSKFRMSFRFEPYDRK